MLFRFAIATVLFCASTTVYAGLWNSLFSCCKRPVSADHSSSSQPSFADSNITGMPDDLYLIYDDDLEESTPGYYDDIAESIKPLSSYGWYEPSCSRSEAQRSLADKAEGAFILRKSASGNEGEHFLAINVINPHSKSLSVEHIAVERRQGGVYRLAPNGVSLQNFSANVNSVPEQPDFTALVDLIQYYQKTPDAFIALAR